MINSRNLSASENKFKFTENKKRRRFKSKIEPSRFTKNYRLNLMKSKGRDNIMFKTYKQ